MIDFESTRQNMKLLNKSELAKRLDVTPALISLVSSGKYKPGNSSEKAARVILALRELRMLVEIPEEGDQP